MVYRKRAQTGSFSVDSTEGSHSGLVRSPGKRVGLNTLEGSNPSPSAINIPTLVGMFLYGYCASKKARKISQ